MQVYIVLANWNCDSNAYSDDSVYFGIYKTRAEAEARVKDLTDHANNPDYTAAVFIHVETL